ncbi:MAG: hypothetical protein U9N38_04435 [Thermodesulfobacteriota bacterium]|nr:hypothetical protein [Thermodesulfobacteriota bacterium]
MNTVIYDEQLEKSEIKEQILIKNGGMFRSVRTFPHGDNILLQQRDKTLNMGVETANADERRVDTVFPAIFFQGSVSDLFNTLSFLGVDTGSVAIDRLDGHTVFVVGRDFEAAAESQIWIDRETSRPLRFIGVTMSGGKRVVLRAEYLDYHLVDKRFWLPERVEYYRNDILWVVSILKDITTNKNLPHDLFMIPKDEDNSRSVANFLNIRE